MTFGRRLLRAAGHLAKASFRTLAVAAFLVVGGVFVLLRTGLGHQVILDWTLDQVRNRVAGSVDVATIRSGNILSGGRLVGVELRTPRGDLFARADSLELRYDLRGILSGDLALTDLRVWGLEMDLDWTPEQAGSTLSRWIRGTTAAPAEAEDDGGSSDGFRLTLSDIVLYDAAFRLRRPTGLDPDGAVRVLEQDGGTLALDVDIDEARVPVLAIAPDADGGTRVDVQRMNGEVRILQRPLEVRNLAAEVRIVAGEVVTELEEIDLPQATASGTVTVFLDDPQRRLVELDLDAREIQGSTLTWLVPWLPPIAGNARVAGTVRNGTSAFRFRDLDATWAGGRVRGGGGLRIAGGFTVDAMDFQFEALPLAAVEPYVAAVAGKEGSLSGSARLDGPVDRLGVLGRVTLRTGGPTLTTGEVSAVVVPGPEGPGIEDGQILLAPLDYGTVAVWVPGLPVQGVGRGVIQASGNLSEGLRFDADLTHRARGGETSRVLARGGLRQLDGGWSVDVQGDAAPFQIVALEDRYGPLPLRGAPSGSFRANGTLDSLALRVTVEGVEGQLVVQGILDPQDLTAPVSFEGEATEFDLGRYVASLEDRTRVTAEFEGDVAGRGEALAGTASLRLVDSRVRGVPVDSVWILATVARGDLTLDTLRASAGGFEVDGGGRIPLSAFGPAGRATGRSGTLALTFGSDSLMGLRPAFLGDVVHARDTLNDLDREVLLLAGIDPDTLPDLADVTLTGRVSGQVSVEGALDRFEGTGQMTLTGLRYGDMRVAGATLDVQGRGLPGDSSVLDVDLRTDSIHALDRDLAESRVIGTLTPVEARLDFDVLRRLGERYEVSGALRPDSGTWHADLDRAVLTFDSLVYRLTAPTRLAWSDSVLSVDSLEVVRTGPDPMRIQANGMLPRRGPAAFRLDVEGLHLERLVSVLQLQDVDLEGHVDLDLDVSGTAEAPRITASLEAAELVVGEVRADATRVDVDYRDEVARLDFRAVRGDAVILEGDGAIPVDLPLWGGTLRTLDRPMELHARLQEMPVAPLLAIIEDLEEVQGTLSGEFEVGGTLDEPEPTGIVRLAGGGWTIGALGVRQDSVAGTFSLTPDGSVAVNARARAGGRVDVSGTVVLSPLLNPGLDLNLRFQQFLAVDRRDVAGTISGEVQITGEYTRPRVDGQLQVDRGTLYLEEFQRAVGVVDLSDPLLLGLVEGDAFTIPVNRPLLAGTRNPFLDSLRVDVALDVPRETWLRSSDTNVEIGGSLEMVYDRPRRDFVLIGELLARRGQYNVLGRTFEVQGGSVEFIGIPGINPLLDIQASSQVRRRTGEPLVIDATVSGTLEDPTVDLSTQEQGVAASDLVSYLIFGRPSTELTATGGSAGGNQFLEQGVGAGVSVGIGTLASQLGALAAQEISIIDYLAVSQVGDLGITGSGSVANTQVEVGWYLGGGDVFGAVILRPLYSVGGVRTQPIGGARLEWQPGTQYRLEAFLEDRLLRQFGFLLTEQGLESELSFGFNLFREWGY
ncbi:MAG TPA: translocation/assembly module TamB domain-containing protein [Longimicrobiales bacterium]|nr:translocation/assembly module TamB domain-containing protein [Longimicrobiales bacterium]